VTEETGEFDLARRCSISMVKRGSWSSSRRERALETHRCCGRISRAKGGLWCTRSARSNSVRIPGDSAFTNCDMEAPATVGPSMPKACSRSSSGRWRDQCGACSATGSTTGQPRVSSFSGSCYDCATRVATTSSIKGRRVPRVALRTSQGSSHGCPQGEARCHRPGCRK